MCWSLYEIKMQSPLVALRYYFKVPLRLFLRILFYSVKDKFETCLETLVCIVGVGIVFNMVFHLFPFSSKDTR